MTYYNNKFRKYGNQTKKKVSVEKNFFNPYCFSPISERVYIPKWRNMISQDIPFSDGVSGFIDVTFEALTPIIVKEGKDNSSSVNMNGRYFIPATSIKGMIRNVMEILTLSKIGPVTKDNRYSMRDLTPANKDYTLKRKLDEIKAGLLVKVNGNYGLIKCPVFKHKLYNDMGIDFGINGFLIKNAPDVSRKYESLGKQKPLIKDANSDVWLAVFTGFMQNKEHEFYFKIPKDPIKVYNIPETIKNFLFVYEREVKSESWEFWKAKIKDFNHVPSYSELSNELCYAPVFYTVENKKISSLGLAFLHRELYSNSIHDFLSDDHKSDDLDMSQCIFGSPEHDLKGRVQFSPAFVEMNGKTVAQESKRIILGSPKPTFYPFYLKQDKDSKFASTFSDDEGKINGWKRYLVHDKFAQTEFKKWNKKIGIEINPLPARVTFTTRIRFHNLKPVELGALLSALTFHDNSEKCFHLIGMGKPLGYGKLKMIDIKPYFVNDDKYPNYYMALFEKEISTEEGKDMFKQWKQDVTPLFRIASGKLNKQVSYPGQGKDKPFEDFKAIKNQNLSISDFSPSLDEFELKSLQSS